MAMDDRARALLGALNELSNFDWTVTPGSEFYAFTLKIDMPDREQFIYHRSIKPAHISAEPFRTALTFLDEACERFGRYMLLRPENAQP